MDLWKSDLDSGDSPSVLAVLQESVESPNLSCHSDDDNLEDALPYGQVGPVKIELIPKSAVLAKKRLQAFCAKKCESAKESKNDNNKSLKAAKPKIKKTAYPDESAKAVIRDIELLKRAGYGFAPQGPSPALPANIFVPGDPVPALLSSNDSTSAILKSVSDQANIFKKREIKCRNIRKNDINHRRSVSPTRSPRRISEEVESTRSGSSTGKKEKEYPKNWTEYKEMGFNLQKDEAFKAKLRRKSRDTKFEFKKYFNFETPSVPTEGYKTVQPSGEMFWVPFSFLRCTATQPSLIYSTNHRNGSKGFLSRKQLFTLIPREQRLLIEELGKYSKRQPDQRAIFGKWYPKTWKKFETSEAKLLENSVGLSFLQSYSDEEEEAVIHETCIEEEGHQDTSIKPHLEVEESISEEEKLTPVGTPKVTMEDSAYEKIEDITIVKHDDLKEEKKDDLIIEKDKDDLRNLITAKRSRWDYNTFDAKSQPEASPVELDKDSIDLDMEEYELKKELELLESMENNDIDLQREEFENIEKEDSDKTDKKSNKKRKKKRREKKYSKVKGHKRKSRKSSKRKKDEINSSAEESSDSEKKTDKKRKKRRKKKKDSKTKLSKDKSRNKTKKLKRKNDLEVENDERFDPVDITDKSSSKKKKSKDKKSNKTRKKRSNSDSKGIETEDNTQEDYEDDIKFFADRLDAEKKLKGKYKHNHIKAIITLDDLTLDEDKDSADSQKTEDESTKKNRLEKTEDVKVDLLKLNEAYLRGQSREADMRVFEASETPENSPVSLKEIKQEKMSPNYDFLPSVQPRSDEVLFLEDIPIPPTINKSDGKVVLGNTHETPPKRKRNELEAVDDSNAKKSKSNLDIIATPHLIPLSEIKVEKDLNNWESDEEPVVKATDNLLDIELPSVLPTLPAIEIKVEKDILSIEELQKQTAALIAEGEKRLKKERISVAAQKSSLNVDPEFFDIEVDVAATTKKDRWNAIDFPEIKEEKLEDVIDLDSNNSGAALENQYEEFIKSVENPIIYDESKPIELDSSSNSSLMFVDEYKANENSFDVPTMQIPLPPMKPEQPVKPVPSPTSKIEAKLDLNKPMINLSVSANVTQNITLSLATSMPSITAPTTSTINISKPSVEISNDTMVSMNNIPLPMTHTHTVDDTKDFKVSSSVSEPLISISPTAGLFKTVDVWTSEQSERPVFTSLTLPSKKVLGSSSLVLDKSDEEVQELVQADEVGPVVDKIGSKVKSKSPGKPDKVGEKRRHSSPRRARKEFSPRSRRGRDSPSRKRLSSPRRRILSSRKRSPRRRSPLRRRDSPIKRGVSPRKRDSPRRRRSPSPRHRLSSPSKIRRDSPRRRRSASPKKSKHSKEQQKEVKRSKSPGVRRESSPLKRRVADSTISDDQLQPQPITFKSQPHHEMNNFLSSPIRLRGEVGLADSASTKEDPVQFTVEAQYEYEQQQYSRIQAQITGPRECNDGPQAPQSTYRQVGNMLQIVPTDLTSIPMPHHDEPSSSEQSNFEHQPFASPSKEPRSTILQVGNMLQIVPTEVIPPEMIPVPPPVLTEIKTESLDPEFEEIAPTKFVEKSSAEASIQLKVAELRAEREQRRLEREMRRKEKEKRRKEKENVRQARLKVKTEDMIKRALELEEEEEEDDSAECSILGEQHTQWPPLHLVVGHSGLKDVGKGILINRQERNLEVLEDRQAKRVQFADGIRPGEGTSPSAGEELTSPPPPQPKLPKEKRYKKIKLAKKSKKRKKKKVKVTVIKSFSPVDETDSDDNLPPPSPPPGSPPPHLFPPRIKVAPVNNVPSAYLASIIHTAQQQQQQQAAAGQFQSNLYRPPVGLMMAPPALPQGHLQSVHHHIQSPLGTPGLPPMSVPPPSPHQIQGPLQPHPSHLQSPLGAPSLPPSLSLPPPHSPHPSGHLQSHSQHNIMQSPLGNPPPMPPGLSVPPPSPHSLSHSTGQGHLRHY